eukprot:snap_masked-scaffold_72-processed-gene-0.32-mRNA-1 protein AED:1.00 eAED:1.00 QI:0/-1/0/0/-1/1/1/0/237
MIRNSVKQVLNELLKERSGLVCIYSLLLADNQKQENELFDFLLEKVDKNITLCTRCNLELKNEEEATKRLSQNGKLNLLILLSSADTEISEQNLEEVNYIFRKGIETISVGEIIGFENVKSKQEIICNEASSDLSTLKISIYLDENESLRKFRDFLDPLKNKIILLFFDTFLLGFSIILLRLYFFEPENEFIASLGIHSVVISLLCICLTASVNWFVKELKLFNKEKQRHLRKLANL